MEQALLETTTSWTPSDLNLYKSGMKQIEKAACNSLQF